MLINLLKSSFSFLLDHEKTLVALPSRSFLFDSLQGQELGGTTTKGEVGVTEELKQRLARYKYGYGSYFMVLWSLTNSFF